MNRLVFAALCLSLVHAPQTFAQTAATPPRAAGPVQVQAQGVPAKPSPTPDRPAGEPGNADVTTAAFGDWQMSCRPVAAAAGQPGRRRCEVLQSVVVQGQSAPFAQLGFGKMTPAEPLYFTAVVPPNVTFPGSLKFALDDKDKQPVELSWTRCLPGGCFASIAMKDDVLKRWRAQDQGGRLLFRNGAGQDLVVPVSLKGLARALDALAREN
ncbi:MAG: hypothetical protein JWM36_1213 [Hyphomicrobiales bacterium]|nr:hypothetical protein [Hyphomicrobiales bacterium]